MVHTLSEDGPYNFVDLTGLDSFWKPKAVLTRKVFVHVHRQIFDVYKILLVKFIHLHEYSTSYLVAFCAWINFVFEKVKGECSQPQQLIIRYFMFHLTMHVPCQDTRSADC
jgi:hypothetical protein